MPRVTEKVKVNVTEEAKGEERIYTITVRAPLAEFFLSDAFAARGLVTKLADTLEMAAKDATQRYITAADKYLKSTANGNGHHATVGEGASK